MELPSLELALGDGEASAERLAAAEEPLRCDEDAAEQELVAGEGPRRCDGSSAPSRECGEAVNRASPTAADGFAEGVVYTERYADGSVYVGTFRKNCREGNGTLTYANGDVYEGQFVSDKRQLYGRLTYACGDLYEGEFYRDEQQGKGSFQSISGWSYKGQFHESMIHGEGMIRYAKPDFPPRLLNSDDFSGPDRPAVAASSMPGSLRRLMDATRLRGRYCGQFQGGLRHGRGRVEFEAAAPVADQSCPRAAASNEDAIAEATSTYRKELIAKMADLMGFPLAEQDAAADAATGSAAGTAGEESAAGVEPALEQYFFEGEWENGSQHGHGIIHIEGHLRYEGEFSGNEPAGNGRLTRWFQAGERDVFEGCFESGAMHGRGTYAGPDGTAYRGEFARGVRHGTGELEVRGTGYVGEFSHGARHGTGRYQSPRITYEGTYREDHRHGFGVLVELGDDGSEQSVYEGEFLHSMRHGNGKLRSAEFTFEGSWCHNSRHGQGTQTWNLSGDTYVGQWAEDRMHGDGELITASIRYLGQFVHGEQEGQGLQKWRVEGDFYQGHFARSRPHGFGAFKFVSRGETYEGQVEDGEMSGEGTYRYVDGSTYTGQWRCGRQNGLGRLTYQDGSLYCGQFQDNSFHGRGLFTESGGCTYSGAFEHNHRLGELIVIRPDGQHELRRYDAEGQEIERKRTCTAYTTMRQRPHTAGFLPPISSAAKHTFKEPSYQTLQSMTPRMALRTAPASSFMQTLHSR
mmetsp:Transcript_103071/g.188774  ORF Transcript_103071/g.188774 Transcript_103071/m.188774 type:complete len:746 (-) Transcript_103071:58-2295(-)